MRRPTLLALAFLSTACAVQAGSDDSGRSFKESAAAPPESWYGDSEWNVLLWGGYALTGTEADRSGIQDTNNFLQYGDYDRFIGGDHAWGGGIDVKYFVHRCFG